MTPGCDVISDHVNTARTLCREAAEVTGKHCSRCIIKRNNVTVEHRDVIPSRDEVTVLGECSVITNTPVKYIMLLRVVILLQKTWRYILIARAFFENVTEEKKHAYKHTWERLLCVYHVDTIHQ